MADIPTLSSASMDAWRRDAAERERAVQRADRERRAIERRETARVQRSELRAELVDVAAGAADGLDAVLDRIEDIERRLIAGLRDKVRTLEVELAHRNADICKLRVELCELRIAVASGDKARTILDAMSAPIGRSVN
jgi:hypothetical protein